jgi:membrane protease YdiL (CAAX protease family)
MTEHTLRIWLAVAISAAFFASLVLEARDSTYAPHISLTVAFGAVVGWLYSKPITDRIRNGRNGKQQEDET